MKGEHTKEEVKAYYQDLRERWNAAKRLANEDEIKAIIQSHGLNISVTGYAFVAAQMEAQGLSGFPYLDMKTFQGWRESGFSVQKGQKSTANGLTWVSVNGREMDDGSEEKSNGYMLPKVYHLFHRSQVAEIAV